MRLRFSLFGGSLLDLDVTFGQSVQDDDDVPVFGFAGLRCETIERAEDEE